MKAREVYKDCLYAKQCFQKAVDQGRSEDAKLFWFAALAMLRAVGHVLEKVDGTARGGKFQAEVDSRFRGPWKKDPVFKFIDQERNLILKEYDSTIGEQRFVEEGFLLLESGDSLLTEEGDPFSLEPITVTRFMKLRGEYAGTSPVHVLSKALEWWDNELSELEKIP